MPINEFEHLVKLISDLKTDFTGHITSEMKDVRTILSQLAERVAITNGRVTSIEKREIEHMVEIRILKTIAGVFLVPVLLSFFYWVISGPIKQYFTAMFQ